MSYTHQDYYNLLQNLDKQKQIIVKPLNIRNNNTIIRKIIEDVEQITMGQQVISIKFSADYVLNQRLNIRAFYDKVVTNPFISTTFPGSITNAGFSLRFTLAG